ncbi:MAG: cytochrome C biogenesis protein, partial [Cyanobacteria bacterium J06648_11]
IQLAVPLLASIALVLMGATFYESRVGSAIVQEQVYRSSWFGLLMFGLAVNLGVSALTRFPWRGARKVGFALTHLGLIVLIAGSAAVIHLGVEGMLPLRTDLGANRSIRLQGEVFEALLPDGTTTEVDVAVGSNGTVQQRAAAGLTMLSYRDRTRTATSFEDTNPLANPALHLTLTSQRMGQAVDEWLAASPSSSRQVTLGPATLELVQARTDDELQRWMSPPALDRGRWGAVAFLQGRKRQELDVEAAIGQSVDLGRGTSARLVGFWPDFRLNDRNEPDTASQNLNNPALQVQIASPQGEERWFVFGREGLAPVRTVVSGEAIDVAVEYLAPAEPETNV